MSSTRSRLLVGLALGFLVALGLALYGDVRAVRGQLASFQWSLLPLILTATLFNYTLRFFKWHYYLALIGVRDLPWMQSARLFVAGFPLAVTPGKAGEAMKALWLKAQTGTPAARGVTVVLAERISDGLAVLILSTLGVISYPRFWPLFLGVLSVLLALILLSQIRPLAERALHLAARLPLLNSLSHQLQVFYEGANLLFRPRPTLLAAGLGTIAWFGEGVAMYYVLRGLRVPAGAETLSMAVFVLSFSTVIGAISALPGGLGAAEVSIAAMLTLLMGLPAEDAASATLLIRFATLWFGVSLGLCVWVFSRDLILLQPQTDTLPERPQA
jgi:uncharacterized protein (TIRG00374 family)